MKDYIKRLARGEFEYKTPVLEPIEPIQSEIIEDSESKFFFEVNASGQISGSVHSTDSRVHTSGSFRGDNNRVDILVDSAGSNPGDKIEGIINIITSAGQRDIPFSFTVTRKKLMGDDYCVEDMESFVVLAKKDFKKAEEIFTDPQFITVVLRNNIRFNAIYEELSPRNNPKWALKNFLIAIGREDDIPIEEEVEDKESEKGPYESNKEREKFSKFVSQWKKLKIELTRGYLDFRMKKIELEDWASKGLDSISNAVFLNMYNFEPGEKQAYLEMNIARAMLLALKGEGEAAKKIIINQRDGLLEDRQKTGILYYTAMYVHTISEGINGDLESARKEFFKAIDNLDTPWPVLIYQYHLDREAEENASIWLTRFKDAFNKGCTSPIIYLEAIRIINREPVLLRVLNAFETQVIRFAYKYRLMESGATSRFTELVSEENKTDLTHLHCLRYLYDEYNSDEILSILCSKMILENLIGERYAPIYERAIKRQLKITRLFEYYIMSIYKTAVKKIPEIVLRYFVYDSGIDQNVRAYLYAYVVGIRKEEPEIFGLYRNNILLFTKERLSNGFIDDYLIVLYRWLCEEEPNLIESDYAIQIFKLKHTFKVNVESDIPVLMHVRHLKFNRSRNVPVKDRKTFAFILGDNESLSKECIITFEDEAGNIYTDKSFTYSLERVLDTKNKISLNEELCVSDPFYNLDKYKESLAAQDEESAIVYAKNLIVYDGISRFFYEELRQVIYGNIEAEPVTDNGPDSVVIKSQANILTELEERLSRMLFTKEKPELTAPIFKEILELGGDGEVVDAYVAYQAFLYFVKEKYADDQIFDYILNRLKEGKKQLPLELAALLKRNTVGVNNISEEDAKLYSLLLKAFIDNGYILKFFKDINKSVILPGMLGDKSIIEYKDMPGQDVWLTFNSGRLEGKRMRAKEMFCGIYTYTVTLFEDEKTDFTVNVINEDKGDIFCHGTLAFDCKPRTKDHTFEKINDIIKALKEPVYKKHDKEEGPGKKAREDLNNLLANQALNKQIFEMI